MTWLLRFLIGLPARPEDKTAALHDLPELADEEFASSRAVLLPGWFVAPNGDELRVHSLSVDALRICGWMTVASGAAAAMPAERPSDLCCSRSPADAGRLR